MPVSTNSFTALALAPGVDAAVAAAAARALYELPFADLIFRAQTVHRANFDPNEVQMSTLLSIKTGGCPEDCAYCPQSARHDPGQSDLAISFFRCHKRKRLIKGSSGAWLYSSLVFHRWTSSRMPSWNAAASARTASTIANVLLAPKYQRTPAPSRPPPSAWQHRREWTGWYSRPR